MNNRVGYGARYSSGVNILAGIWLIIAPYVLTHSTTSATTSNVISGAVIAILAVIAAVSAVRWPSWLNLLAGIWVVISPFVIPFTGSLRLNDVLTGAVVVVMAAVAVMFGSRSYADESVRRESTGTTDCVRAGTC